MSNQVVTFPDGNVQDSSRHQFGYAVANGNNNSVHSMRVVCQFGQMVNSVAGLHPGDVAKSSEQRDMVRNRVSGEVYKCSNEIVSNLYKSIRTHHVATPQPHTILSSCTTSYSLSTARKVYGDRSFGFYGHGSDSELRSSGFQFCDKVDASREAKPVLKAPRLLKKKEIGPQEDVSSQFGAYSPAEHDRHYGVRRGLDCKQRVAHVWGRQYCDSTGKKETGISAEWGASSNENFVSRPYGPQWNTPHIGIRYGYRARKESWPTPGKHSAPGDSYPRNDVYPSKRQTFWNSQHAEKNSGRNWFGRPNGNREYNQQGTTVPAQSLSHKTFRTFYVKRERDQNGKPLYTDESSSSSEESEDEEAVKIVEKSEDTVDDGFYVDRICDALEKSMKEEEEK